MIGTYEGARKALEGDLPHLASGTSRHVYRDGNLVYKIDIGWDESNLAEWDTYQKILSVDLEPNIALAETNLFMVDDVPVICMEYIDGQPMADCYCNLVGEEHNETCLDAGMAVVISKYIDDTGGMNVVIKDGIYYLIDFGE